MRIFYSVLYSVRCVAAAAVVVVVLDDSLVRWVFSLLLFLVGLPFYCAP